MFVWFVELCFYWCSPTCSLINQSNPCFIHPPYETIISFFFLQICFWIIYQILNMIIIPYRIVVKFWPTINHAPPYFAIHNLSLTFLFKLCHYQTNFYLYLVAQLIFFRKKTKNDLRTIALFSMKKSPGKEINLGANIKWL